MGMANWRVYLVRARGGVLYAGISTDVERRLALHRAGKGAKFLRGRGPLELVYSRKLGEHGLALRVERRLKGLAKAEKEALVRTAPPRAKLLQLLSLSGARAPSGSSRRRANTRPE
jgi:putative endonuclease